MSGGDMGGSENVEEIKLKPCPFCGCSDRRVGIRKMGNKGYRIVCARCGSMGAQINILDGDKIGAQNMAREVWNKRVGQIDQIREIKRKRPKGFDKLTEEYRLK